MNKDRIINLIGASGSGKTAVAKELDKLGFHIIQSYTNRNPRYKDEWGHTFIDKFIKLKSSEVTFIYKGEKRIEEFIAYFNNYEKHEHYFATKNQYKGKGTSVYIVDTLGAKQVKEIVTDIPVLTVYLVADESVRKQRLLASRDQSEVSVRLKRDREIFNKVPCDYAVNANRPLDEVASDVVRILCKEK